MAVNSPGTFPVTPRSPKSPLPSSPAGSKTSTHFTFVPPRSPGGPKSPNHYCPKSPGSTKNSTHFNFGPKSPGGPKSSSNFNYNQKSPGGPKSPVNYNYGPKSPGGPKSPRQQQFTFGPKSPGASSKGSGHFTFSPGGQRSSSACNRSSSRSRSDSSGSVHNSTQDITSTDTASTSSSSWTRCRRSTSDLTDLMEEDCSTTATSISRPCSPRSRAGSIKGGGGLAYLASRRGSRDSQISQASAEDVGPLNFSSNPRGRQRRTSNFLELPGNVPLFCLYRVLFFKIPVHLGIFVPCICFFF